MGNEFSRSHLPPSQKDGLAYKLLRANYHCVLYTVLEFLFTHSAEPDTFGLFLTANADVRRGYPIPPRCLDSPRKNCNGRVQNEGVLYILCVLAATSSWIHVADFESALLQPMNSEALAIYQKDTYTSPPAIEIYSPSATEYERQWERKVQLLSQQDYELLDLMRRASRKFVVARFSGRTGIRSRPTGGWSGRVGLGRPIYGGMGGAGKVAAVEGVITLLEEIVVQAGDAEAINGEPRPRECIARFAKMLPADPEERKELLGLGKLKRVFENERARLRLLREQWECNSARGGWMWPRWGNPRVEPRKRSVSKLDPPELLSGTKELVLRFPGEIMRATGREVFESGFLLDLRAVNQARWELKKEDRRMGRMCGEVSSEAKRARRREGALRAVEEADKASFGSLDGSEDLKIKVWPYNWDAWTGLGTTFEDLTWTGIAHRKNLMPSLPLESDRECLESEDTSQQTVHSASQSLRRRTERVKSQYLSAQERLSLPQPSQQPDRGLDGQNTRERRQLILQNALRDYSSLKPLTKLDETLDSGHRKNLDSFQSSERNNDRGERHIDKRRKREIDGGQSVETVPFPSGLRVASLRQPISLGASPFSNSFGRGGGNAHLNNSELSLSNGPESSSERDAPNGDDYSNETGVLSEIQHSDRPETPEERDFGVREQRRDELQDEPLNPTRDTDIEDVDSLFSRILWGRRGA